jgi:hypothetical protein
MSEVCLQPAWSTEPRTLADQAQRVRLLGLRGVVDGFSGSLPDAVTTEGGNRPK